MRILFDTNIVLHHLRNDLPMVHFIRQHYQPFSEPNEALISIVSIGELESLAIRSQWGEARYQKLQNFLQRFLIMDINYRPIVLRYGEIDAFSQGKLPTKPLNSSARNMGKNDLWIAATASVLDAKLLTTDADFGHLKTVFLDIDQIPVRPGS
jgi:tRNA(fMet)-specific endonuclease VapC